jgi:hypothetical protein
MVGGDLTSFPVLITIPLADYQDQLETGFDFGFFADSGHTQQVDWESAGSDGTNARFWVRTNLSSSADTVVYFAYGNADVITDQSNANGVWDSGHAAVFHFGDDSGTLNLADSTVNAKNAVATDFELTDGKIGKAAKATNSLSITGHTGVQTASDVDLTGVTSYTLETWINVAGLTTLDSVPIAIGDNTWIEVNNTSSPQTISATCRLDTGDVVLSAPGNFAGFGYVHIALVVAPGSQSLLLNGQVIDSSTIEGNPDFSSGSKFTIGGAVEGKDVLSGAVDETRFSSVARSQQWLDTLHQNMTNPLIFTNQGAETDATATGSGYSYMRTFTIQGGEVRGTEHTHYPLFLTGTLDALTLSSLNPSKSKLQTPAGNDFCFFADANLTQKLDWEIDTWNKSTGDFAFWVRIPSLGNSANTPIYLAYGNPSVTTDQTNATAVWDAGFEVVWHYHTGQSNVTDSTSHARTGYTTGSVSQTVNAFGTAAFLDGSASPTTKSLPTHPVIEAQDVVSNPAAFTLECWANVTALNNSYGASIDLLSLAFYEHDISVTNNGGANVGINAFFTDNTGSKHFADLNGFNYADSDWHHYAYTVEAGSQKLYLDGVSVASDAVASAPGFFGGQNVLIGYGGGSGAGQDHYSVDEVRVSTVIRSPEWIAASYANQSDPAAYITIGDDVYGTLPQTVTLSGVDSEASAGTVTISTEPNAVSIALSGIDSGAGAGTINSDSAVSTSVVGIDSETTIAAVTLDSAVSVSPAGIDSEEAVGSISTSRTATLNGIDASEEFGSISVSTVTSVAAVGIGSAEAIGSPILIGNQWGYSRSITIDHTKVVGSDQTDFPVYLSLDTDAVKLEANGGKLKTGTDFAFFSDETLTTPLDFEVDTLDTSTGKATIWVRIPSLSQAEDTVIYLAYGDSSVETDQSNKHGVWTDYAGVYHFSVDGSGNLVVHDSSVNARNGVVTGAIASTSGADTGVNASLASANQDKIQIAGLMGSPAEITLEGWFSLTNKSTGGGELISIGDNVAVRLDSGTQTIGFYHNGGTWTNLPFNETFLNQGWHHIAYSCTAGAQAIYVDGALVASGSNAVAINYGGDGSDTFIGAHGAGQIAFYFGGLINEVRVSSVIRSADWLATQYHNQSSPSTFYTIGSEIAGSPQTIGVSGIVSAQTLGSVTVSPKISRTPTSISSSQAPGTLSVAPEISKTVSGIGTSEAAGTLSATSAISFDLTAIGSKEAIGPVALNRAGSLTPAGINTEEAVGPISTSSAVILDQAGIETSEELGSAYVSTITSVAVVQIESAEALGSVILITAAAPQTIAVSPVDSAEAVITPVISGAVLITADGIISLEAAGYVSLTDNAVTIAVDGITSAQETGTVTFTGHGSTLSTPSITSAQKLSTPNIKTALSLALAAIQSGGLVTSPELKAAIELALAGIDSGETVQTPSIDASDISILVHGVSSAEALGHATIALTQSAIQSKTLEAGIHALLKACTILTDIVPADRIEPGLLLHNTTFPALSYRVMDGSTDANLDRTAVQEKRIQFAARGTKYSDVKLIEAALLRILGAYQGYLASGVRVLGSFPGVVTDLYEPETRTYLTETEFDIQYAQPEAGETVPPAILPVFGPDLLILESGLHSLLINESRIADLVSADRIYPVYVPEESAFPAISYSTVSASADYNLDGSIVQTKRIQFDLFGRTYDESKQLQYGLASLLGGFEGVLPNGTRVIESSSLTVFDDWEGSRLYRTAVDYSIQFVQ